MNFYRRKLPHWQPAGAVYFITVRLAGTIPREAIEEMKRMREKGVNPGKSIQNEIQRKIFQKYESILDEETNGPDWLKRPEVAQIMQEAIHFRDSIEYDLYAYCIMSNHIHLVFKHLFEESNKKASKSLRNSYPITDIMRNFKRYTAYKSNQILEREGSFWQSESYDRVIRDEDELENTIRYTLNNPVKAGLVKNWKNWPYSYCKPEFAVNF